jgi:uracil-DNA glycosylase family 4
VGKRKAQKSCPQLPDHCPVCGESLVLPYGPDDAIAIVVSNQPGEFEIERRRPFVPQAPAGRVLHREFLRVGLNIDEFRLTNVWMHPPGDGRCLDWHMERCAEELCSRRAVLLLGSIPAHIFMDRNIMSISGIVFKSGKFPNSRALGSAEFIVAGPNPADALHGTIGECRLAIERFAQIYKRGLR